jgi:hypothetical protein
VATLRQRADWKEEHVLYLGQRVYEPCIRDLILGIVHNELTTGENVLANTGLLGPKSAGNLRCNQNARLEVKILYSNSVAVGSACPPRSISREGTYTSP